MIISIYTYICVYIYISLSVWIYVSRYTKMSTCTFTCINSHIHIFMNIYIYIYTQVLSISTYVKMNLYTHVCIYIYHWIHLFIHIHSQKQKHVSVSRIYTGTMSATYTLSPESCWKKIPTPAKMTPLSTIESELSNGAPTVCNFATWPCWFSTRSRCDAWVQERAWVCECVCWCVCMSTCLRVYISVFEYLYLNVCMKMKINAFISKPTRIYVCN